MYGNDHYRSSAFLRGVIVVSGAKSGRQSDRRETLLQVAAEVFFEQGYAATSIDAIIERAGGSKRNIYSEFGNKEGLFSAIIEQSADRVLSTLALEKAEGHDLRTTLTTFGERLLDLYMSPTLLGIYRIVGTEAHRFPHLVKLFYEQGPGRATARLAEVLEAAKSRGEIRADNCLPAAGHFVAMIRGNLHLKVVLGLRAPPSAREARDEVASVVDLFLHGLRVAAPAEPRQKNKADSPARRAP
jgi:AcrR family transcriptional regulator